MTQLEKYHLEKIIVDFNKKSIRNQFEMFFDLKGKSRLYFNKTIEQQAIKKAYLIFVRIYKNKFQRLETEWCEQKKLYLFKENLELIKLIEELDQTDNNDTIITGFAKFEKMKDKLILKLNAQKLSGNTTTDLGNFIAQTIYEFIDDDLFTEDDFISGFEHGIDSMKEP